MHATIDREVTRIAREMRGGRPDLLTTSVYRKDMGAEEVAVLSLRHPHLEGTSFSNPGIPDAIDGETLGAHARREVLAAIDDIVRREARAKTFGHVAQDRDGDRPWTEYEDPPTWSLVAHPVLVHALMRAGANDLPAGMLSGGSATPGRGVRIKRVQDLLVGQCPLDPLKPDRGRVISDDLGMMIEIAEVVPHVSRTALIGHPIGALVSLPPCGDAGLDAEVEELMIAAIHDSAWNGRPGILVSLSAARWRACAPAPDRVNERAMRTPAKIA